MSSDGETARVDGPPRGRELPMPNLHAEDRDVLRGAGGEPATRSGEDARSTSILARAAAIRFPDLSDLSGREKIDALVDHITNTAIARGELEELRLEASTNLLSLRRQFNGLLPGRQWRTKALADDARRLVDPELAEQIDLAGWLVSRCTDQINRLGGTDYDAASRAYTLLSGS